MNLLDSLRYLAALAEHRHFGRAAQACHITRPALSNAVRALEDHFGTTIVRRGRQDEGLTPEGELALAHGHRLLHEAEALRQAMASRAGAPSGRLVLGVVPSAEPLAARFAGRLQALHPGLQPVLRSPGSPEIEAGLDGLAIDLGPGYTARPEVRTRQLAVWPQYTERCWLLQTDPQADPGAVDAPLRIGAPIHRRRPADAGAAGRAGSGAAGRLARHRRGPQRRAGAGRRGGLIRWLNRRVRRFDWTPGTTGADDVQP